MLAPYNGEHMRLKTKPQLWIDCTHLMLDDNREGCCNSVFISLTEYLVNNDNDDSISLTVSLNRWQLVKVGLAT